MTGSGFHVNSLLLYKKRPARLIQLGEKVTIELESHETILVRPKDVALLHPGPVTSLGDFKSPRGDILTAWELLSTDTDEGKPCSLQELAELVYGVYTPDSAWATYELLSDGLYFYGDLAAISVRSPVEVAQEQAARQVKAAASASWKNFLERLHAHQVLPVDEPYLRDVAALASGAGTNSRVLRELGRVETSENAHALLLELGWWNVSINPYPARLGVAAQPPELDGVGDISLTNGVDAVTGSEDRVDMTGLAAYAIDDQDNQDPDDALSLDGDRLWVHVADVAALATPDSPLDRAARERGATLYLPEGQVPMLPWAVLRASGLGLQPVSPALSFGLKVDSQGELSDLEIVPSWVRVQRLTYFQVEQRLEESPFQSLLLAANRFFERRKSQQAVMIDLPEVMVKVTDGRVRILPVEKYRSRLLVREAMLMAGEAVARYAIEQRLPFAFVTQSLAALPEGASSYHPDDLAGSYALRRAQNRSQLSHLPGLHAGLGLPAYSRVTSPLRRYSDLLAHQQVRASLGLQPGVSESDFLERLGAAEMAASLVSQAENKSQLHWTLVYLQQNPGWRGQAVIVEKHGLRAKLLLPDLEHETSLQLRRDLPLNSQVELTVQGVNLPNLEAYFRFV